MPKSAQKPGTQKDDAVVRAAKFTGVTTALAAIIVAVIGLAGKCNDKPPPDRLIVKVVDKTNHKAIGNAKVSLEASGVFAVNFTDSNGVISFPIADPKKELRLRVEADGYEQNFNLRVTPAVDVGAQEIKLTPIAKPLSTTSPAIPAAPPSTVPSISISSIVRGQVIDEIGAPVPGAKVTVRGYGSAVETNESGNFQLSLPVAKGKTIDLHIAKDGFKAERHEHIVNSDSVEVKLRRKAE